MRRWRLGSRPPSQRTPAAPTRSDPAPLTARKTASACTSAAGARIHAWASARAPRIPRISTAALTIRGRALTGQFLSFELVTHTPDGLDVVGQIGILLDFFSKAPDVDCDGSLVPQERFVPDAVQ